MSVSIRGVAVIFLTVSLLALAFYSARILWAEMFYLNGVAYLEHWDKEQTEKQEYVTIHSNELAQAKQSFQTAIRLQPDNPRYALQASKLYYWQDTAGISYKIENREGEWDSLRKAIRLRPAWPYGWLALVLSKSRYSVIDAEFNRALLQAMLLGPWEPAIKKETEKIGSHYYHWLDDSVKSEWDRKQGEFQ